MGLEDKLDTARIARELLNALDSGSTIPSIVARNPGFGWDEGYRVAAELIKLRRARGEHTVGRKIGFTNRNIWAEYGATAPIWAHIYERTLVRASDQQAAVSLTGSARPRLEPEIAFKLKAPLPAGTVDPGKILRSIEWYAPSFEIVDCHFADWKFGPADAAADFSLHWRLIVGTPCQLRSVEIPALITQLRDCRVTLSRNGAIADRGVGANALGHPLSALAHVAEVLSRQPQFEPLAAGEIITTGTLTAALPIRPGETWSSRYEGLPGVEGLTLTFTE
jgi:2-oxo-3-hexenedioate decarboxylase